MISRDWRWVASLVVGLGVGWLGGLGAFWKACSLVWARTTMKATAKCDQHCSVNHQKFESMLFFRVILEHIPNSY